MTTPNGQDPHYGGDFVQQQFDVQRNPTWMGRIEPEYYQHAPGYGTPVQQPAPVWTPRQAATASRGANSTLTVILLLSISGFVASVLLLFFVLPNLVAAGGVGGVIVGFLLSLVPLGTVLLSVYFIDRWEPEPKIMLLFALVWGSAVSIGTTLLIQPLWVAVFMPHGLSKHDAEQWLAHFEAPPVEEFSKGLGVLLLALFARKYVDGVIDGVVYATVIAAGFAFTENIQYFGSTFADSEGSALSVGIVFLIRGIFSPFGHALYTGCIGAAIGWSVRKNRPGMIVGAFFLGLLPAMLLHFLWNSAELFFVPRTVPQLIVAVMLQSVVYEFPLIVLWVIAIALLRRAETKLTMVRLYEYSQGGWFTPEEVTMLATPAGRRSAMSWARSTGRAHAMKVFIRKATQLAFTRQRMLNGHDITANQRLEHALLNELTTLRWRVIG